MAGIVPALKANDDVGLLRQPVDDLALSLVAPLGADDDNIGHSRVIPMQTVFISHDPRGKPVSTLPGSCRAQLHPRPGPLTCEAAQPDKGSGLSRQARTGLFRGPEP